MTASRIVTGVRVGTMAAAATIGAVIGLGLRHGLALQPFTSAGRALLDALRVSVSTASTSTVAGLALVACAVIVLGVCFTFVAAPLRGLRLLITAILFAAIGWALSVYVAGSVLALTSGTVLGTAQRAFVGSVLALALVAGMRLARAGLHID